MSYNVTLGWIIDSGANQHMTMSTKNMLHVINISSLQLTVGHPNGAIAKISAIGSLTLSYGVWFYLMCWLFLSIMIVSYM